MFSSGCRRGFLSFGAGGGTLTAAVRALFAAGEQGAYYDFGDFSAMFQDSAGTTPVTAVGQPVGMVLDKSGRGNHGVQVTAINRPILQQDASGFYYLACNGTNSFLAAQAQTYCTATGHSSAVGFQSVGAGTMCMVDNDNTSTSRFSQMLRVNANTLQSIAFNTVPTPFTDSGGTVTDSTNAVACQITTPSAVEVWMNNVSNGATAITGTLNSGSQILRIASSAVASPSSFLNGRLYSVVHIARVLSTTERQNLQRYVGSKTGISL